MVRRGPIARVEVSTDGGATWAAWLRPPTGRHYRGARVDPLVPHLAPPTAGTHQLWRAGWDLCSRTQPDVATFNPNGYFFDAAVKHLVTVA